MKKPLFRAVLLLLICVNLLCSSLFLSWQFNRSFDYFYPMFYDRLEIGEHIHRLSPWNQNKKHYHTVGQVEHIRVFSELVDIVHNQGIGLKELKYYSPQGEVMDTLLTEDEVAHMQEVASLVTYASLFGLANLALTIFVIYLSLRKKIRWPSFKYITRIIVIGTALTVGIMALIGFSKIFYQFHVWAFSDAPWMFSFSESLLIILTKSPQFFGAIAATIFFPAILFFIAFMFCLCKQQQKV